MRRGGTTPKGASDARVLVFAYVAVAFYFPAPYLQRPTASGVIQSLLWPVSLALALAWLTML